LSSKAGLSWKNSSRNSPKINSINEEGVK
jgi:hypothetical protein